MISIVNTECHVPKMFSDLAKIAAWGRLGLLGIPTLADEVPSFEAIRAVDAEMADIGQRLTISNARDCGDLGFHLVRRCDSRFGWNASY